MSYSLPVVILTDIFGRNPYLDALISQCNFKTPPIVVSPYGTRRLVFESQTQAYNCFISNGGLDSFVRSLEQVLVTLKTPHQLIGFSAGGSAIWQLLDKARYTNVIAQAICFYPGQIRHNVDLTPLVETTLIFPAFESHFDLKPVIDTIEEKQRVRCHKTALEHGFMNQQLSVFNQAAYVDYCQLLG